MLQYYVDKNIKMCYNNKCKQEKIKKIIFLIIYSNDYEGNIR